jgi:hypothetical protein
MGELEASLRSTHIRYNEKGVRWWGESEMNTATYKGMGQSESKDQEFYIQL